MNGKISATRIKLIRTFFWIVKASGMGEDNARAVAERMYKTSSLKELTTDELKNVIDELAACTGVELRKPEPKVPKAPKEDRVVVRNGKVIELPTKGQLASIEYYADKMEMAQETLQHMIKKAASPEPFLTLMSARTLIEILKSMHGRGWKGRRVEESQTAAGKDN
jgi:hypothetical protein